MTKPFIRIALISTDADVTSVVEGDTFTTPWVDVIDEIFIIGIKGLLWDIENKEIKLKRYKDKVNDYIMGNIDLGDLE